MGTIRLMHAKLHRVRVTAANLNYVGSISIDPELLTQVGILPLEEVDIINLNNGHRFSTYAIPGIVGSREICPNGGAALLCSPGDLLIIYAYETCDRRDVFNEGHQARVLVADENNNAQEFYVQTLQPSTDGIIFQNQTLDLLAPSLNNPLPLV
ncbi:MAG: aspartate 1-decarboxylase [Merismopediaceae bacterium]|nr:aspartate 1-decarboxylase [Merismopediaceae bacterium]